LGARSPDPYDRREVEAMTRRRTSMRLPAWSKACVRVEPFGPEEGVRILRDRIVICRKSRPCALCGGTSTPRTPVRVQTALVDGAVGSCVFCTDCCLALVKSRRDNGEAIERRVTGRWVREGRLPPAAPAIGGAA